MCENFSMLNFLLQAIGIISNMPSEVTREQVANNPLVTLCTGLNVCTPEVRSQIASGWSKDGHRVISQAFSQLGLMPVKAQPHTEMLHTCDRAFQSSWDVGISHAMLCNVNSNMFNILLLIMEYFSHLLSAFQTVCSILMDLMSFLVVYE